MAHSQWSDEGLNMNNFITHQQVSNMQLGTKKFTLVISASLLIFLSAMTISTDKAFADHMSENTTWQLVMISSAPACSNYHYQMMFKYDQVTEKYLELYEFENTKYEPLCFTDESYLTDYEIPEELDLQIIVMDRNLGEKELHGQDMGGVFTHSGNDRLQNHAIILCADCSNFYFSDPVWILTHELSHFVLYYLDYDLSVVEDTIHENDNAFDQCRKNYVTSCSEVVERLRIDSVAYSYTVIPPYEAAIGEQMYEVPEVDENLIELTKEITVWWTEGKINDGDFANALGYISGGNQILSNENNNVLLTDGPIDDTETWEDLLLSDDVRYSSTLLDKLPYNLDPLTEETQIEEEILGLPEWFKTTATWWTQDEISNDEIVKSIEYLFQSGVIRSR